MFSIHELPRADGLVSGDFYVRHKHDAFDLEGFGFRFVAGLTVEPVRGRIIDRLAAAYGPDVSYEPANPASAELALAWMRERGMHPARVADAAARSAAAFRQTLPGVPAAKALAAPAPAPVKALHAPVATPHAPASSAAVTEPVAAPVRVPSRTPKTIGELDALGENALRGLAAELGFKDRRWAVSKVRAAVAEELNL